MKKPTPQGNRPKTTLRWFLFALFSIFVCAGLIGGIVLFAFYVQLDHSLPSVEALKNYHPRWSQPSTRPTGSSSENFSPSDDTWSR
jgi:membrane carboxypeptidase/penicillin-binding protein